MAETQIIKELNSLDGKKSLLIICEVEKQQNNVNSVVEFMIKKKKMVCAYISLNKPYQSIKTIFDKLKIKTNEMYFIDTITSSKDVTEKNNKVTFVTNPSDLVSISLASKEFLKNAKGDKFIIIDALQTLLIYNQPDTIAKFAQSLVGKGGLTVIIVTAAGIEDKLTQKIIPFFEGIVDLNNKG